MIYSEKGSDGINIIPSNIANNIDYINWTIFGKYFYKINSINDIIISNAIGLLFKTKWLLYFFNSSPNIGNLSNGIVSICFCCINDMEKFPITNISDALSNPINILNYFILIIETTNTIGWNK